MARIDTKQKEMEAYRTGPFNDVKVQEALTIIAVYAAQIDYQNCEPQVQRLVSRLLDSQWFVAGREEIFSLVNKFVNEMELRNPNYDKALEIAADALTPEQRKAGFALAVRVAMADGRFTDEKKKIFDTLEARLSINGDFAEKAISQAIRNVDEKQKAFP